MTSLLLDSHALLWWLDDSPRLTLTARQAIESPDAALHFSAASVWELAIKRAAGKLDLPDSMLGILAEEEFAELQMSAMHGLRASALPAIHKDPFDRMLVAQAQCEGLTLVTCDPNIPAYDVPTLW